MIICKPSHSLPSLPTDLLLGSIFLFANKYAVLKPATASERDLRLNCEFSEFHDIGYTEEFARIWITPTQTHIFEGNTFAYDSAAISFHRKPAKSAKETLSASNGHMKAM
jgi:hypothetical protein